MVDRPE